jgi:hypothetical protein
MATKKSSVASKAVKKRMHEYKHGQKMGGGRKIKNPKQAIAIGLDEARRAGANVPPNPNKKKATKKATKKVGAKKAAAKKAPAKKGTGRKTATKRTAAKKATAKKGATNRTAARKR